MYSISSHVSRHKKNNLWYGRSTKDLSPQKYHIYKMIFPGGINFQISLSIMQ